MANYRWVCRFTEGDIKLLTGFKGVLCGTEVSEGFVESGVKGKDEILEDYDDEQSG